MHCVSCQSPVTPGGRYCSYCGAPVKPRLVAASALRLFSVVGLAGLLVLALVPGLQRLEARVPRQQPRQPPAPRSPTPTTPTSVVTPHGRASRHRCARHRRAGHARADRRPRLHGAGQDRGEKATSIVAPHRRLPPPDACQQVDNFEVANLQDGDFATAYRVKGSGVGRQIRLRLAAPTRITEVGLVPGWAKVGCDGADLFRQHRTVARVRWTFDGGKSVEQAFNAAPDLQVLAVDVVTKNVTVRILATNPPNGINMTAVSEIRLSGVASA